MYIIKDTALWLWQHGQVGKNNTGADTVTGKNYTKENFSSNDMPIEYSFDSEDTFFWKESNKLKPPSKINIFNWYSFFCTRTRKPYAKYKECYSTISSSHRNAITNMYMLLHWRRYLCEDENIQKRNLHFYSKSLWSSFKVWMTDTTSENVGSRLKIRANHHKCRIREKQQRYIISRIQRWCTTRSCYLDFFFLLSCARNESNNQSSLIDFWIVW